MPIPRRDFMKLFGISLGSMLLARCQRTAIPTPTSVITCYTISPPTATPSTPTPTRLAVLDRLRLCWLGFGDLAEKTRDGTNTAENLGDPLGSQMISDHRSALDELVASESITPAVADLVQEAYAAAVFHVWRSNAAMTCYLIAMPAYAPADADDLLRQAEVLDTVAGGSTIAPDTLAKVQAALEHDLAFYALTDAEVQALYERLREEYSDPGESLPTFEELELTLTPDVRSAAQFLIDVLMG
ncbi:MAG: hypothetical protein WBM17_06345 [Anaerolineales bacterium]